MVESATQTAAGTAVGEIRQVLLDGAHYTDDTQIDLIRRLLNKHKLWSWNDEDAYVVRRREFVVEEHPDLLAFDGSNAPQKRRLTARDRDVIVRILSGAHQAAVRAETTDSDSEMGVLAVFVRDDPAQLAELMFVLCPRP